MAFVLLTVASTPHAQKGVTVQCAKLLNSHMEGNDFDHVHI